MKKHNLPVINKNSCSFDFDRKETCDYLDPLLKSAGVAPLNSCDSCNMPESLELLHLLDTNKAIKALDLLNFDISPKAKNNEISCIHHNNPIVAECSLSECSLYTTYPGVKNCILIYMDKHNVDSLSTLDLSMLLSIPHKSISEDLKKILANLRKNSVKTASLYDMDPLFKIIPNLNICYCCEKLLSPLSGLVVGEFKYCGPECLEVKPPEMVRLEYYSGLDMDSLIIWSVGKYSSLDNFVEALGLSKSLLEELVDRYFGTTLEKLYNNYTTDSFSPVLMKRSGRSPSWLEAIPEKTSRVYKQISKKYGPSTVDMDEIISLSAALI